MAKSIRSKRMRKFRAIKRTINKPKEDLILRHVVSGGNDPSLPPIPVLPHQRTSGFSFWSVIDEYKKDMGQVDAATSATSATPAAMDTVTAASSVASAAALAASSASGTDLMVTGDASNEKLHKPLTPSAIKKRKSKEKLRRKGIRNTKRFNL